MGREIEFIRANAEFKKVFNQFCLDYNLDTFQAIRILSRNIEATAHEARNISLIDFTGTTAKSETEQKLEDIQDTVNRWNVKASENHTDYLDEIIETVYQDDEQPEPEYAVSEHRKLSHIWALFVSNGPDTEPDDKLKEIKRVLKL